MRRIRTGKGKPRGVRSIEERSHRNQSSFQLFWVRHVFWCEFKLIHLLLCVSLFPLHCKKGYRFPVPSRDVINQTIPWPGIIKLFPVWLVTSRLGGTGETITFYFSVRPPLPLPFLTEWFWLLTLVNRPQETHSFNIVQNEQFSC